MRELSAFVPAALGLAFGVLVWAILCAMERTKRKRRNEAALLRVVLDDRYPSMKQFYQEFYPKLSEEGKGKVHALFNEYGVSYRDLTDEETEHASEALVAIVHMYSVKS